MPNEPNAIEPAAGWLAQAWEELLLGETSTWADTSDVELAALILSSVEVENLQPPSITRDSDGTIRILWWIQNHASIRSLNVCVKNRTVIFRRYLNGRQLAIARGMLAKGALASLRELLQWVFHQDIHRRVEDVSKLIRGE